MNVLGIGSIVEGVGKVADDLFTSDEERLKIALQEKAMDIGLSKGQLDVNMEEAKHSSVFVAGWRPFIGWVGGFALAYQFILYPILLWIWALVKSKGWVPQSIEAPPVFETGQLFAIVTGMLGIGGMRSFDKLKNTQTTRLK